MQLTEDLYKSTFWRTLQVLAVHVIQDTCIFQYKNPKAYDYNRKQALLQ